MKSLLIIGLSLFSFVCLAQKDSPTLKFNSVQFDGFGSSLLYNSNNFKDFQSFYKNKDEYKSVLGLDSTYRVLRGTSGSSGIIFKLGFTPYSKSKQQYLNNQEIVFGVGYTTYYSPSLSKYYRTNITIDSITTYSISETNGDTLNVESSFIDSVNTFSENYHYFTKKIMIYGEWNLAFVQKKKSTFSIGVGTRLSILYGGQGVYNYTHKSFLENSELYGYYNQNLNILSEDYSLYRVQNGLGFAPYLKLNYGFQLSQKDNVLSHFSIEANTFIGGSFHKIFKRPQIISELLYGVGIGLKYSI